MSTRARVTKQVNTRIRGGKHLSGGPAGSTDPRGSVRSEAVGPDAVRRVPLGFRRVGEPARQRNKFPCSALASFREQAKGEDDVTEEAVRQYYDSHPEQFTRPERISASHILARERTAADAMLAELRNGADFATLAQDRSQDEATRDRAGRIFVILRGQMTPEFEAAAFALEPGGTSDVVQDKDGYHLIQLHERPHLGGIGDGGCRRRSGNPRDRLFTRRAD